MKWVVYLIENKINGKGYVGITNEQRKTYLDRFNDHLDLAASGGRIAPNGRKYPIYAAISKYGAENFSVELLEDDYFTLEEAQEREQYWIEELDTYASHPSRNGYNLTFGGEDPDWDPDDYNYGN